MPTYRVTDPETNQTLRLTGDSPPTEQELEDIFASYQPEAPAATTALTPAQRTEELIASRESLIPAARASTSQTALKFLRPDPRQAVREFLNPVERFAGLHRGVQNIALQTAAGQEGFESAQSTPMLALQRGRPQDILPDLVKVLKGERVTERGDVLRAAGAPEPVAATVGVLSSPETAIPALFGLRKALGAGKAGVKGVAKTGSEVKQAFTRPKLPATPDELLTLPEDQVARLPQLERQAYLSQTAQRESQALATKRLQFEQRAQKITQFRQQRQASAKASLPQTAADDLASLNSSFRPLATDHSRAYTTGVNDALANAEAAVGKPISFTRNQLNQAIAQKYLKPMQAGQPQIPMEDVTTYQTLTEMLARKELVNQAEISARQLLNLADEFGQEVGVAAKNKARAYTPHEVAAQHLRDILLDLLEQRGVDVSQPKGDWAKWVPVRNLGLKLQTPAGPNQLIRILKGQDPIRAQSLRELEILSGERLDRATRQVFEQLDYLKQRKVLEQAKQAEFDRLIQGERGFQQQGQAARKLRIEQRARHLKNIRTIVYSVALAAAAGSVGPKRAFDFVNPFN